MPRLTCLPQFNSSDMTTMRGRHANSGGSDPRRLPETRATAALALAVNVRTTTTTFAAFTAVNGLTSAFPHQVRRESVQRHAPDFHATIARSVGFGASSPVAPC